MLAFQILFLPTIYDNIKKPLLEEGAV